MSLIPLGTIYDPFVARALEPWSYGMYAGGQSILVGTPSGVTLAPEGGAQVHHHTVHRPGTTELHRVGAGVRAGLGVAHAARDEPRRHPGRDVELLPALHPPRLPGPRAAAGGPHAGCPTTQPGGARECRITHHDPATEAVTLVGVGAVLPEVVDAARVLGKHGIVAGVVCLTSPDLVFRSWEARSRAGAHSVSPIIEDLFPATYSAPLVAVLDGHPHTLSFLAGARGDPIRCLGVRDFGQSSSLTDAYALHEIDSPAIVDADLALVSR